MIHRSEWRRWEREAQERRLPPPLPKTSWDWRSEPGLWAQLLEWIARHWLICLLLFGMSLSILCLIFEAMAMRGAR